MFTSMGQRNMLCTRQLLDLESERDFGHPHTDDHIISRDTFGYVDHIHPVQSGIGNSVVLGLQQVRGHHDRSTYYGNQYNNIQNYHHIPNHDFGRAALPNSYPSMFHPTCSRSFFIPQNTGSVNCMNHTSAQIGVDEYYGRENLFIDDIRVSCNKSKNAEVVPGNYSHLNRSGSSSLPSSYQFENSGLPQWNAAAFTPPEYQENGILQTFDGPHRNLRRGSGAIIHQHDSAPVYHCDYLLQGNNMGQSFQPDNIGVGDNSSWNNAHAINYMHGRGISSGAVQVVNTDVQGYQELSSSRSSSFRMHPASIPNFHHHAAHGQNMQTYSYGHHSQVAAPHQYPCSNFHRRNANPCLNGLESNSRFAVFPSSAEMIFSGPAQLPQPALAFSHGGPRILLPEDAALLELARFYGVDDIVDEHRDMRLDIDDMSYEELLALEEHIGDVNTGLTEESILQNLKMTVHEPNKKSSVRYSSLESETCAVCQVEYLEQERIGTLDCGHYYHVDCIKQWLLVKNMCPICKEPALVTNRRDA